MVLPSLYPPSLSSLNDRLSTLLIMITAKINTSYQPLQIRFGQAFVLREWDNFAVSDDKDAPNNGFLFKNKHPAAAVLYGLHWRSIPAEIDSEASQSQANRSKGIRFVRRHLYERLENAARS